MLFPCFSFGVNHSSLLSFIQIKCSVIIIILLLNPIIIIIIIIIIIAITMTIYSSINNSKYCKYQAFSNNENYYNWYIICYRQTLFEWFQNTCSNLFKIGLKIVNDILKINDIRTVFI